MQPIVRVLFIVLLLLSATSALAEDQDSAKFFDDAHKQIADIRKDLGAEVNDTQLGEFRDAALSLGMQAEALVADRTPKLQAVDARLAELGPAPAKGAPAEAADVAAQRASLDKTRAALDSEIKRAKLLAVESQQLAGEVAETRRTLFQARMSQRTPTPLGPAFWKNVAGNSDRDGSRLNALGNDVLADLGASFAPGNRLPGAFGIALGLLLLFFGRRWMEQRLMRLTANRVPQGRLRRSALAFAVVIVTTLLPGLAAQAVYAGFNWNEAFTDSTAALARSLVNALYLGGLVAGLGRGLLSAERPSWRLPPIPDEVATRMRRFPLLLAVAVVIGFMLNRINSAADASLAATIAASFVIAMAYSGLIGWTLLRTGRALRQVTDKDGAPAKRSPWVGLALAVAWLGVIVALLCAATGFVALAHFLVRQLIWISIVAAAFYLLVHLVEDLCTTALSSRASWLHELIGIDPKTLDQFAVLLSGAFRIVAFVFAVVAVLGPFGASPSELIQRSGQIGAGLKIGQIEITPGAVFSALVVFALGLLAIRALQRWLSERYLPTTHLDPGMNSSVTTLLGYAGGVIVFGFALSALGLSVERIAWVVSALSVGIGFGLQAIVQNFISGLILLVERPVKIGDWVVLGDTEGDIRRINVRATEIQMGDRSTVIVPNSELITKTVRNITLANAEGRVLIRLPMPLDCNADQVRQIMLDALTAHPGVLAAPAPSVLLEGIVSTTLVFVATAYIASPRQVGGVRSDLLFDILARLRAAGIPMSSPQDLILRSKPTDSLLLGAE